MLNSDQIDEWSFFIEKTLYILHSKQSIVVGRSGSYKGTSSKERLTHRQPRRVVSGVHLKIEKGENICNSTK